MYAHSSWLTCIHDGMHITHIFVTHIVRDSYIKSHTSWSCIKSHKVTLCFWSIYQEKKVRGSKYVCTHCNILQHTTIHCNTLQHTATHYNTLQHTATYCNTLQYTAAHCNILQHTATHYKILQKHDSSHKSALWNYSRLEICLQIQKLKFHGTNSNFTDKAARDEIWISGFQIQKLKLHSTNSDPVTLDRWAKRVSWSMLQYVAVHFEKYSRRHQRLEICVHVLQRTATHCNTLQRTATHCNALQRTATHCNALQRTTQNSDSPHQSALRKLILR